MKVLHLVQNFPPEFTGGTERAVADLVVRQRQQGLHVSVLCGSEERRRVGEPLTRPEDWHGVPVERFRRLPGENFSVPFHPEGLVELLQRRVEEESVALIHVHHWFNLGDRLLGAVPGPAKVATFHDSFVACPRFFFLRPDGGWCGEALPVPVERCVACVEPDDGEAELRRRLLERRATYAAELQCLDVATAPSVFHARLLEAAGMFEPDSVHEVALGIEPGAAPAVHRPAPGRLRLASFGHLSRIKGTDLLIEAVSGLAERDRVELHLFGRVLPEDEPAVRAAAEGLDVRFHGPYQREDLVAAAHSLDVAVFPSRAHETYSLVVEEARRLGLPVVVSERGALPERIEGWGVTVDVARVEPLREILQSFLNEPQRLDALRARVPDDIATVDAHARRIRELYDEALVVHSRR